MILGTLRHFKSLPQWIREEVLRKLSGNSEVTISYGGCKYWFGKETLEQEYNNRKVAE